MDTFMRTSSSFAAKFIFSMLLLGAAVARVNLNKLTGYFADISPSMLFPALFLAMLQISVTSLRWHLLLLTVGVRLPLRTTLEVNILSIFANSILVNVIGGVVTRITFLLDHNVSPHSILATSLLERAIIAIVLGGMTVAGLWMSGIYLYVDTRMLLRMVGFGMLALMAITIIAYAISKKFRTAIDKTKTVLLHTLSDLRTIIVDWRGLVVAFVLTFISQMMLVGVGVLLGHVLQVTVPLWQMAMILPGIALISSLPIGLGGFGLREISMVTILGTLGVAAEQALVLSITIGAVTLGGSAATYGLALAVRTLERRR